MPRGGRSPHIAVPFWTRFWLRVWPRGDCWEWRGTRASSGHGLVLLNHEMMSAHRLAYTLAKGPIPSDRELDHLCRHRWCVKPSHLEAVVTRVNVLRSPINVCSIHARTTHCPRGHAYDTVNTRYDRKGSRYCRECARDHVRLYRQRHYDAYHAQLRARYAKRKHRLLPLQEWDRAALRCLYEIAGLEKVRSAEWRRASKLRYGTFYRARQRLLQHQAIVCDLGHCRITSLGLLLLAPKEV